MRLFGCFFLFVFFLFMLNGGAAWAQTATLVGIISDPTGAALKGVSIKVIETATELTREAESTESGSYSVPQLRPGLYRVEAELSGFKTSIQKNVQLQLDERVPVDFRLEVGETTELVEVLAPPPILETDDSSIGSVISGRQIQDLPVNRRQMENMAQLTPGVVTAPVGSHLAARGGFNEAGMDEHSNSHLFDGIDNVDPGIRNFSFRALLDLIQEFKIQESGSAAEFGRNAGAVVNVITKSGSNAVHGSSWEYLMNDNLDARNFFALADKPPLVRNQFGATLGGPLKPGRTFFFGAYEGLRFKDGLTRRASVPTGLMRVGDFSELGIAPIDPNRINPIAREVIQAYPLPNRPGTSNNRIETADRIENGNDLSGRLDHKLTERTNIAARFSSSITRVLDPFRTETSGGVNLSEFGQTADRLRSSLSIAITTVKRPNLIHQFRAGYSRFKQPLIPLNPGTPLQTPLMGLVHSFLDYYIGPFDPLGSGTQFTRVSNVYNYIDNVSYLAGNHQIKAGVDVRRYLFNASTASPNYFVFAGARSGLPLEDFLLGLPYQTGSVTGSPTGNSRKFELAWYVQDDWKVTPHLTLNYGLRWEFYGRMAERVNKQSMWLASCNCMAIAGKDLRPQLVDNDLNNFAPRLGLAWRPFPGATVIRASGGIFYDNDQRTNFELITNPPFVLNQVFYVADNPDLSLSNPFPANPASLVPATTDLHFRDTYVEQWNLNIQHEISPGLLAEIGYVGSHMVKSRRERNVNQGVPGALPYAGFAQIFKFEQAGSSSFNSLQAKMQKRFARGAEFTAAYTWSHSIDDRPLANLIQNNNDMRAERADSDFDARHRFSFNGVYDIPSGFARRVGGLAATALSGWSLSGVGIIQGGRPFGVTFLESVSLTNNFNADRPNIVPGVSWKPARQGPNNWINPAAFSVPSKGTFGNAGRNILRGPGLRNFDLALLRQTHVGERTTLQFRAELFNAFNHANFAPPNSVLDISLNPARTNFGTISSTAMPERQMQFGLRVAF
jgi:hypothetical protein